VPVPVTPSKVQFDHCLSDDKVRLGLSSDSVAGLRSGMGQGTMAVSQGRAM